MKSMLFGSVIVISACRTENKTELDKDSIEVIDVDGDGFDNEVDCDDQNADVSVSYTHLTLPTNRDV